MKEKRYLWYLFFSIIIVTGINSVTISLLNNIYLGIGIAVFISMVFTFLLGKGFKGSSLKAIKEHLSNLKDMNFSTVDDESIPTEIKDELRKLSETIKNNLRTQVEISTEMFNICRQLHMVSQESLESTESIASSVEVADSNTIEQSNMLEEVNNLTHEIFLSLENMGKDVTDKINFIGNSMTTTQQGIESIKMVEGRIRKSKNMSAESMNQILKLRDYSDEIVGLIDLINSISKETNMLSLNASIEAARAGEHGKGFAIVAMEVGKLANETEKVSSRIEEVIHTLKEDISSVTKSMEEEMNYTEENCAVIEDINKEFENIIKVINLGNESLEGITEVTKQNNDTIEEITTKVEKVTSFSQEIAAHMEETTAQVFEQHNRAKDLQEIVDKIRNNAYDMQQLVAGKVMEEKMLREVYYIKDYVKGIDRIDDKVIEQLLLKTGMDAINITDASGIIRYTNEKSNIGLNIYEANEDFLVLKTGKQESISTPIKLREGDNKPFMFLAIIGEDQRLYEVGLALETLIQQM